MTCSKGHSLFDGFSVAAGSREKLTSQLCPVTSVPLCVGCGLCICERYLVRVRGRLWHEHCAVCSVCSVDLPEFCFVIDDKLLCRQDYHRLYATKCATCQQPMLSHELCMRVRPNHQNDLDPSNESVHHVSCFVCSICGTPLAAGEMYTRDPITGALICRIDHLKLPRDSPLVPSPAPMDPPQRSSAEGGFGCSTEATARDEKRGRTTLSCLQRSRLMEAFNVMQRPSKKLRESLAWETNLSTRVVQVWFQNQRARDRRLAEGASQGTPSEAENPLSSPSMTLNDQSSSSIPHLPTKLIIRRHPESSNWHSDYPSSRHDIPQNPASFAPQWGLDLPKQKPPSTSGLSEFVEGQKLGANSFDNLSTQFGLLHDLPPSNHEPSSERSNISSASPAILPEF